ncbi:MAG: glucuronate isomerase, partial [Chloroflexi bacterium]|nr:glucuronate isomerase [Chloroflexota bacterium]
MTGKADPFEKFKAWAATVPHTLRNPLYHWTHLELKRYFGIDELLDESSATRIWKRANAQLATSDLSAQGILAKFHVKTLCTTDDPVDDLAHHRWLSASRLNTRVLPAFRPDKALAVNQPDVFLPWKKLLEKASNRDIHDLNSFLDALRQRHDVFHEQGCRLSDHGLIHCFASFPSDKAAASIFSR